jgi:hypothetical protein
MRVIYTGPIDKVAVTDPASRREVEVERGQIIDVPDELGASLITQDTWDKAPAAKARAAKADEAGEDGS